MSGNGNWNSCDRSGCQTNVYNLDSNVMCPESRCKINTNNWYQLVHYQNRDTATIYMEQDGQCWAVAGVDQSDQSLPQETSLSLRSAVTGTTGTGWPSPTLGWFGPALCGEVEVLT